MGDGSGPLHKEPLSTPHPHPVKGGDLLPPSPGSLHPSQGHFLLRLQVRKTRGQRMDRGGLRNAWKSGAKDHEGRGKSEEPAAGPRLKVPHSLACLCPTNHPFIHLFVPSFVRSFICSFIHLLIHSLTHSFTHSLIHSFIPVFDRSFSQSVYSRVGP